MYVKHIKQQYIILLQDGNVRLHLLLIFFKTSYLRNTITLNELMLEKFDYYK